MTARAPAGASIARKSGQSPPEAEEVTKQDIEADLSEIADWLREQGDGVFSRVYSDGTCKHYDPVDSHMEMARRAQAACELDC